MERIYSYPEQRESILLGYDDDPSTSERKSDVDFNDVFGGPPRRRSSVNESVSGEESETGWCSWPPESEREKPVFGEDSGIRSRRRYPNKKAKDFFDDIFGGEESQPQSGSSTPKKRDGAAFSPALQPLASSLPTSSFFSLPAIMAKGSDLQTFGSPPRNPLEIGIAASNGLAFSDSHLSRFSAQHKELQTDLKPSSRQSLLSKEFSNSSLYDEVDKGNNMKQDASITEVSPNNTSNDKFHFSIYKWASKGVPWSMPLRTERTSRTKDKFKLEKSSSVKEWIVTEITAQNDSLEESMVSEITIANDSPIIYNGSSSMRNKKQDVLTASTTTQNKIDSHQTIDHIVSAKPRSDSLSSRQTLIKDVLDSPISSGAKTESSTHSTSESVFYEKNEVASETQKNEIKSLHSLFSKSNVKQVNDEITRKGREENVAKSSKVSSNFDIPINPKKQDEKRKTVSTKGVEYSKATSRGSLSPGRSMGKGRVKGKVKDFVQIFNQETVTKPKDDSKSRPQSYTYKQKGAAKANNDVDGDPEKSKKIYTVETLDMPANNLPQKDDISASEIPDTSFADIGDQDESFHENFTIEVLSQDEDDVSQNQDIQEIQVIDKKIQQWSKGKEGNIRSLLSTLQYVLWPNCGWKPVPLVDIIEGNAVKRSYQRALLSLHPDKLQQKGATSEQKYIAEKVFDILQEAWTQFNMVGAL
ncbi:molecular chaperone, variant 2 [Trifolium repens]|nr:molecular chaperone, variant 2 [Trifolium repens]